MRPPRRALRALHRQTVEDGKSEGCGLAGAGLGDAEQILAFDEKRDGLRLNWRRLEIAFVLERALQRLGQAEAVERSELHLKIFLMPKHAAIRGRVALCADSHALPGVRR